MVVIQTHAEGNALREIPVYLPLGDAVGQYERIVESVEEANL